MAKKRLSSYCWIFTWENSNSLNIVIYAVVSAAVLSNPDTVKVFGEISSLFNKSKIFTDTDSLSNSKSAAEWEENLRPTVEN